MSSDTLKKIQEEIFNEIAQFQRVFQPESEDAAIVDLINNINKGKIDYKPEYQRKYVWDQNKASYFIESILYGIDTPIIYFVEAKRTVSGFDKTIKEVIDGRQRLETIFNFYTNKNLRLVGLRKNTPLFNSINNCLYRELPEKFQNALNLYRIRTVTFKIVEHNTDYDKQLFLKYELFRRYNSGMTSLNQQEIRNCIYYKNDFLQMFKQVSESDTFSKLCPYFGSDQRMAGVEFVSLLYFLSIFDQGVNEYAKKAKNPFIDKCYERLEDKIYNFNNFQIADELKLIKDEEDEEDEDEIVLNEEEIRSDFFKKSSNAMIETFEKILKIYGSYLKGERQERYVIEVLYYILSILSQNKKITDKFITANGQALGQIIHRELHNPERKHPTHSFTLEDSVTEQTFNTQRVLFRFSEIGIIINNFVQKKA